MQTAHQRTSALHVDQEKRNAINRKRKELKRERKNKEAAAAALAAAKFKLVNWEQLRPRLMSLLQWLEPPIRR